MQFSSRMVSDCGGSFTPRKSTEQDRGVCYGRCSICIGLIDPNNRRTFTVVLCNVCHTTLRLRTGIAHQAGLLLSSKTLFFGDCVDLLKCAPSEKNMVHISILAYVDMPFRWNSIISVLCMPTVVGRRFFTFSCFMKNSRFLGRCNRTPTYYDL